MTRWTTVALSALATTSLIVATAPSAHADRRCGASSKIVINDGEGGEAQSSVWGHEHTTGDHYIHHITRSLENRTKTYYWYADNDNKLLPSRDERDTPYGYITCPDTSTP
ncbi:hypothetical protein [Streptomyces lavendulocolor]|uniref:hypothetical protein n=1 Tax=Streptomyces lavendulocolor TaxID=67316 RepID=UPI003C2F86CD